MKGKKAMIVNDEVGLSRYDISNKSLSLTYTRDSATSQRIIWYQSCFMPRTLMTQCHRRRLTDKIIVLLTLTD